MRSRFKQMREYFGLSQAQFAERIHMSPGFVSKVETGRSNVSEKAVDTICEVFPISREWLTIGKGDMIVQAGEYNPVDKVGVSDRVKAVRKSVGLTQEEFAREIGYSKIQVQFVELERVTPSNRFLQKVADKFKISSDWLFTGVGEMENREWRVDDKLIAWLNNHPEVLKELRIRAGLE